MKNRLGFFDRRASDWEKVHYPPYVRQRLEALVKEFGVRPGERVLDVGTGTGVLIPYLCGEVGSLGWIFAVDLSFQMLRQANRKPRGDMDIIVQADVHFLPFANEIVDRVICFAAFPHFRDKAKALREMSRVLRHDGILIIAHLLSREELAKHHNAHPAVACDTLPDNHRMRSLFMDARVFPLEIVNTPGKYMARGKKEV